MRHPLLRTPPVDTPVEGPRRSGRVSAGLVALAAVLALLGTAGTAQAGTWEAQPDAPAVRAATDAFEDELLAEINAARVANDRRRISGLDTCVDRLAELWGAHLAQTGVLEHRDQNQVLRLCDVTWAGETLVRGTGLTPATMVRAWLDSPDHRAILLSRKARRAGVAVSTDLQGRLVGVLNVVRAD